MPPEYAPNGAGTLAILGEAQLKRLSVNAEKRLGEIAWILAQRMASVPNGVEAHEGLDMYEQLCVLATGCGDETDPADKPPSGGNQFWFNHWEGCFERDSDAEKIVDGWQIKSVDNLTKKGMDGAQLVFEYNNSAVQAKVGEKYGKDPPLVSVAWSKYHADMHVAAVKLRSFREQLYIFQKEGVQYLALNSAWRHKITCVTPRPKITLFRFPAPGIFESALLDPATNQVALTIVDTGRLHWTVLRYAAQAPSVECPTMEELVEHSFRRAILAGADWESHLKLDELCTAYKSMFEGPARDNATPSAEGTLMATLHRNFARVVLLRWINGFQRRKARKQLAAAKAAVAAGALKLKRKRGEEEEGTDDYGFAF